MAAVEPRAAIVVILLAAGLVTYAGFATMAGWWPSALAAPVVALLLARRHPRARFAAYVLLTAVGARAVAVAAWPALAFAVAAIALLRTPVATRVWPRLTPGRTRAPAGEPAGDRMARP